jgi:hypothetical protein
MTNPQIRRYTGPLTEADLRSLSQSATNLDDIDPHDLARAQEGLRHAYRVARRVTEGTLDPLSAP